MTNIYEQLLLTDKAALETKIEGLYEDLLNGEQQAQAVIDEIKQVIEFELEIKDKCCFTIDEPYICGSAIFSSLEDYAERDTYCYADEADKKGNVDWDGCSDGEGTMEWFCDPSVSVDVYGLTEDASEDAQTLWEAQQIKKQLDWKQQQLEQAQRELLNLQAKLAIKEATA